MLLICSGNKLRHHNKAKDVNIQRIVFILGAPKDKVDTGLHGSVRAPPFLGMKAQGFSKSQGSEMYIESVAF